MRVIACTFFACSVLLATSSDAYADAADGQAYFSIMASYIDDDEDRNIDDGLNGLQFGFGWALSQNWNLEGLVQMSRGDGMPDHSYTGLGLDVQRVFRRDERFSPYLHAGVGYFRDEPSGVDEIDGSMYSAGLGFYYDLFDSNVALRAEWRHRVDQAYDDDLKDNLISVGLQLPFGSTEPAWVDADGDGVSDGMDQCPGTVPGAAVDTDGCELDSDRDGVVDRLDRCPNTPDGTPVDAAGCPADQDGDGVADDMDDCPGTPAGAPVDARGCELDGDGDGVVDRLDECPATPAGDPVDQRGCTLRGEYVLEGTEFEVNSDRLTPESIEVLNRVVETLDKYPELEFEVGGHTDNTGAADYNEGLSLRRAQTVHDYLASQGVSVSRMTVRGYGESDPVASNDTAQGRAENRRVSLRVIED